jgi:N12 class adenine-specific DNA methylase
MSRNFRITQDFVLASGGAKTKARNNLAAIALLKQIEAEGRTASSDEQGVLAQYVGWGGIPQVFNPTPDRDWQELASQVKTVLEPAEYSSAFESVLNAHYTSYEVIREIYEGLDHLGFNGGRILEPSMGVGNYLGVMPRDLERRSEVTGIELDSITGRIAKQLYPEHQIFVQGFEKSALPKDYFDLALSNVPFGDYKIGDPEYNDLNLKVHDYFFARSLDRVRPGGLVCFITSTGTMQSKSGKGFRVWMAERANLVGAMRLPGDAFKSNAGTEVTTDLIILQKLGPTVEPSNEPWIDIVGVGINDAEGNELTTNEYYARHPERMLGIPCDDKLYPGRLALQGEGNTIERMRETFAAFPSQVYSRNNAINPLTGEAERLAVSEEGLLRTFIPAEHQSSLKNFGYLAHEDKLWQRQGDWLEQTAITGRTAERIKGMLAIRDAVHEVFDVQVKGGTDAELAESQQKLNQVYDGFVSKQGYLSDSANARAFRIDPDAQLLMALEIKNDETKEVKKADVFSRRTVRPRVIKESAETPQEALLTSLNEYGRVAPGYMAQLLSRPEAEVINELQTQSLIYLEPTSKQWQTQDEYLSGEVREKLKEAKTAAEADGQFQANVAALEAVQPRDLGPGEIEVRLGAPWVPTETIAEFSNHLLELDPAENLIKVEHSVKLAVWAVNASQQTANNALNTFTYGTPKLTALELIEATLNLRDAAVYYKDPDGAMKLDQEATLASRMKQQQVQEKFKGWLWQDFDRAEKLCRIYNDHFNGTVIREFKNPSLEMPGSSPSIEMRAHQKDAVWRTLQSDSTLLAHVVGAGKTFTMVAGAIEMRRLGIAQKPMIVVPNHMLGQFTNELFQLYPNAKVLAPSENETKASKRLELMARISTGDWDAVVVTHSAFTRLPISEDEKIKFYQSQLDELTDLMGDRDVKQGNGIVKQLAREQKKLKERIDKITQSKQKDNGVTFEQLGVDALFVDEAHFWKNLGRISKLQNIAGLSNTNSQRAQDAFMKCRLVQDNGGKLVFATGTPVSNSIAELYTMQRFLQPDALERQGIESFDAWVGAFAEKVTAPEIDPTGRFKLKTRLTRFCNVPELMTLFREVGDIKTAEQLDLPRPQVDRLTIATGASPLQLKYMERLIERAEAVAGRKVEPNKDNMLWVTTDGRRAALDPRLISQDLPDFPESKVNQAIANIEAIWSATTENRLTQVVFCDLGTPKKAKGDEPAPFSIYQHVKDGLIARGIPAEEIAFIHDAPKSKDKENLYAAVREGRIRVLIGSTEKCGVGMNVQERLIAEHHLDPPWRPSDIEQREGRILRQGNRNSKVLILTYVTQGRDGQLGFDSYSWQTLARKAQMVAQVMNGDTTVRSVDDVSSSALSFDEIKAIATGNPLIIEKATVDSRVTELSRYQQSFLNERYSLQRQVSHYLPNDIAAYKEKIQHLSEDIKRKEDTRGDLFRIRIGQREFGKREDAGMVLQNIMAKVAVEKKEGSQEIGEFAGFKLVVTKDWHSEPYLKLRSPSGLTYSANSADSAFGVARSLEFCISKLDEQLAQAQENLSRSESNLVAMSKGLEGTFDYGTELEQLLVRQQEINTELGLNKSDEQLVDEGTEETEAVEKQTPEAKETPEGEQESETGEEAETEPMIDLDAIVSADAKWDWLTDGQVDWDMDTRCSPSAQLLEAIENLDLASFRVPKQDNSLLETLPEEPLFEPVDPPKSSLSPPDEVATPQVIRLDESPTPTIEIEPQQLSLLGQINEPRSQPTQRQTKPGGNRSRIEPEERTPAIGTDPNISSDRSRLTGTTENLRTIGGDINGCKSSVERDRSQSRSDADFQREPSVDAEATPGLSTSDPTTERPTTTARDINAGGVKPSTERDTEINPSPQPSPSMVEWDAVEPQNTADLIPGISSQREPNQFVVDPDGPQWEIYTRTGASERTVEQSRNSTEEAQTSQLEGIASQWTDAQLLEHQKNVTAYFQKAVAEPNWSEQPKFIAEVKGHASEYLKLSKETKEYKQKFEQLGEPRSVLHPFGPPKNTVEDARNQYLTSRLKRDESGHRQSQAQTKLNEWQQTARDYREWRHGPEGKIMHELKPILELKSVQERLTQIHANEKRKEGLDLLSAWEKVAIALGRSSDYVGRIREITVEYSQGGAVSEKAINAMRHDNQALQQIQQPQQKSRGFSC